MIHGDSLPVEDKPGPESIEQEIAAEVADIKTPSAVQLFSPIRLDIECGEWICTSWHKWLSQAHSYSGFLQDSISNRANQFCSANL